MGYEAVVYGPKIMEAFVSILLLFLLLLAFSQ
jgi:hypothetical protein